MNSRPRERERERERARGRRGPRAPVQSDDRRRTSSSSPRRSHAPVDLASSSPTIAPCRSISRAPVRRSHRAARSRELQSDDRTVPIASRRSYLRSRLRAISPSTHRSLTHRSLSLCDFDFCVILIFVVVVVVVF